MENLGVIHLAACCDPEEDPQVHASSSIYVASFGSVSPCHLAKESPSPVPFDNMLRIWRSILLVEAGVTYSKVRGSS